MADQATRENDRARGLSYCNAIQGVSNEIGNALAELTSAKAQTYKENWTGESGDMMAEMLETMIGNLTTLKNNLSNLAGEMRSQVSWAYNSWPEDTEGD